MTFVKYAVIPGNGLKNVRIVPANIVRSNDDVHLVELVPVLTTNGWRTNISDATEEGCILPDLLLPMTRQCRRTYDERWQASEVWIASFCKLVCAYVMITSHHAQCL